MTQGEGFLYPDESGDPDSSDEFSGALLGFLRAGDARAAISARSANATTTAALLVTAAAVALVVGGSLRRSVVVLLATLLVTALLLIDAGQHRRRAVRLARAELLEAAMFAALLDPGDRLEQTGPPDLIALELRRQMRPSRLRAVAARRLPAGYGWAYAALLVTWLCAIAIRLYTEHSLSYILRRATLGPFPGWVILAACLLINGAGVLLALVQPWREEQP